MNRLRQLVKDKSPELGEALERSWKIAIEEWLGTIKPTKGSYNAYPHLRNLENYLDEVLSNIDSANVDSPSENLSLAELYVLFSAILLHDIGRGRGGEHPAKSRDIITEKYSHLGIPSRELAKSIGCIAAAHGRSPLQYFAKTKLPTIVVDPYGEIRQESLAALLRLVDHMDSAYTRVVPQYVVPENELEILGQFRNVVLGVTIDHEARMVKTIIGSDGFSKNGPHKTSYSIVHPFDESCEQDWNIIETRSELLPDIQAGLKKKSANLAPLSSRIETIITSQKDHIEAKHKEKPNERLDWSRISELVQNKANEILRIKKLLHCETYGQSNGLKALLPHHVLKEKRRSFGDQDWLVSRRVFRIEPDPETPSHALLAVVMSDVLANARELAASKAELAIIGLPLTAWLIDFEEHLYNTWGQETHEPIFSKQFLKRIAEGMWELSTRVFGFSLFTYFDLAASVGESDMAKVRRAAHRIAIITQQLKTIDGKDMAALWVGIDDWKWNVLHPRITGRAQCSFVALSSVCEKINALGDPYDEQV